MLKVKNLKASIGEVEILKEIDLEIGNGELHAVMGPNGSGKSTLCHVLMGNTDYKNEGEVTLNGEDVLSIPQFDRAQKGIFQSFQYPVGLPGVTLREFINSFLGDIDEDELIELSKRFNLDEFLDRDVNVDLSGGEKKRSELFQLSLMKPSLALLDEIDSGLDIDALKVISDGVSKYSNENNSLLIITHYQRLLDYIKPDEVHIFNEGKIIKSGGYNLVKTLEEKGYQEFV